jgi:RHS repeat-associated protein
VSKRHYPGRDVVIAGNGAATQHIRDDFGRLLMVVSPDSGTQLARFDAADRPTVTIDGNGNRTMYTYNAAGALIDRRTSGKTSDGKPGEERVSYRYEGTRLIATSNGRQSTAYVYDRNGRLLEQADRIVTEEPNRTGSDAAVSARPPMRFVRRFTYDHLGRIKTQTMASGETLVLSYDKAGRPHRIDLRGTDGETVGPIVTDIEQQRVTGLVAFTHGNGLVTSFVRDRDTGQLTRLLVTRSPVASAEEHGNASWAFLSRAHAATIPPGPQQLQPVYAQAISYDVAGRIIGITRADSQQASQAPKRFAYDLFDHLSGADSPLQKAAWRSGAEGNRIEQIRLPQDVRQQAQSESLQYEPSSNRLIRVTGAATGNQAYKYDAAGNPVRIGRRVYEYSVTGRLQRVREEETELARYAYNANGERVAKTVHDAQGKASTTYFLYHGQQIDAEIDNTGKIFAQYVYLDNIPIAKLEYPLQQIDGSDGATARPIKDTIKGWFGIGHRNQTTRVYAIHSDYLGTPQLVTDRWQRVVWRANYTAFGSAEITVHAIDLNLRFPGQYFDWETGTHYNYFRDYDPNTGRYIETDPIGLQGGINTYNYAEGNPVGAFDPLGLNCISSGDFTTCTTPGGPKFTLRRPYGFPDDLKEDSPFSYHFYDIPRNLNGADPNCVMQGMINAPTPGDTKPATAGGTRNNAKVFPWIDNWVRSYVTKDLNTGMVIEVNIAGKQDGSEFGPGYVVRYVQNGVAHTAGEGTAWLQADADPDLREANSFGNQLIWGTQMNNIISEAKKNCGCNTRKP